MAAKLAALSVGEPTERTAHLVDGLTKKDIEQMSLDQLLALRAQLEKEGGVGRLYAGLRREKAVDLAMSRATITESRRDADSGTSS